MPMLPARVTTTCPLRCRFYSSARTLRSVQVLQDALIETFRQQAFEPTIPALLPRSHFADLPAVCKWFGTNEESAGEILNVRYMSQFGATRVPLEIVNEGQFARIESSLSFFLECVHALNSTYLTTSPGRYFSGYVPGARAVRRTEGSNNFFSTVTTPPTARVYLAQASLADLPAKLRNDVPTPDLVLETGKGDVYDSSVWLGQAPTYTPLHRDPNPNLFVQLAGQKIVRLFEPRVGHAIFSEVQAKVQGSASATMRGEEMMQGMEKRVLEEEVWGSRLTYPEDCWETTLGSGDGLFIPKGWWHSIKGVGEGMTGSVNWWFR